MKRVISVRFFYILITLLIVSCSNNKKELNKGLENIPFIPLPQSIESKHSVMSLDDIVSIQTTIKSQRIQTVLNEFKMFLKEQTSYEIPIESNFKNNKAIRLKIDVDSKIIKEFYRLEINKKGIQITSKTEEGLYRGLTTLKQVIIFSATENNVKRLPTGIINDFTSYEYRGSMLDVARHFYNIEDVKRYIDILSLYKYNFLHLHLSDDQGWRIEIKKWPKLTLIGGEKEVGGTDGGFFSQDEFREIVRYASNRFITIVPEIDIPGHTNSALASYPELNCNGESPEIYTGTEVGFSSLCAEKKVTYKFLKDVIDEISSLTTGPYFHVGGDESYKTSKEDFIQIIDSVFSYVKSNNKTPITWDNNIKTAKITQYWNEESNLNAIRKSEQIIYSPASHAYLDMKYDSLSKFGLFWAGYSSVKNAYEWDPKTISTKLNLNEIRVLGIEAPIWTETVSSFDELAYLVFPRLLGHSEIGWTSINLRKWESYNIRLKKHKDFLKSMEIYSPY